MIGRDEAPGAKLDPVMPGFANRRSPSVEAGVRRSSSVGITVTVANWSVTMGSAPSGSVGSGADGCGAGVRARGPGATVRIGAGRAGAGRKIGLGAVTTIGGRAVCAAASADKISAAAATPFPKARTARIGLNPHQ